MHHLVLFCLLLISTAVSAQATETAVIQIMSRPAASLIDPVRPLLGRDGGVSAFHDRLIVRGTPAEIAAVRALLADLDRPARRLLIEVRNAGQSSLSTQSLGYGVNTGDVRFGRVPPGERGQISYQQLQTRGRGDSLQRVQALDGRPALIRAGQSVPVYQAHQQVIGNTIVQGYNMQYRDTSSGFIALPRVHGDQVTVEIYQQDQRPMANGRFANQQASTMLRGRLGQWLTLGSIGAADSDAGDHLGRHVTTRRAQDRRLELRVLAVD
jgi:type II secretory pathway component GspD/PulD (secretin)